MNMFIPLLNLNICMRLRAHEFIAVNLRQDSTQVAQDSYVALSLPFLKTEDVKSRHKFPL